MKKNKKLLHPLEQNDGGFLLEAAALLKI